MIPAKVVSCILLYSRELAEVSFTDFLVLFLILYAIILHTAIMPSFIHIITEHNCMTTGRYQLPIILMGDFVQLKQTKNNAILALLCINNENNIDKLIVGNIF